MQAVQPVLPDQLHMPAPLQPQQQAALSPQLLAAQQAAFLFQQAQQQAQLQQPQQPPFAQPQQPAGGPALVLQPSALTARDAADAPWVPYLLPAAFRAHSRHKALAATMRQVGIAGGAGRACHLTTSDAACRMQGRERAP